jgi:hypothetical protein
MTRNAMSPIATCDAIDAATPTRDCVCSKENCTSTGRSATTWVTLDATGWGLGFDVSDITHRVNVRLA